MPWFDKELQLALVRYDAAYETNMLGSLVWVSEVRSQRCSLRVLAVKSTWARAGREVSLHASRRPSVDKARQQQILEMFKL